MPLYEIDTSVSDYPDIRHHYVVAADNSILAHQKALRKFRGWLLTNAKVVWAREAEIVR